MTSTAFHPDMDMKLKSASNPMTAIRVSINQMKNALTLVKNNDVAVKRTQNYILDFQDGYNRHLARIWPVFQGIFCDCKAKSLQ